MEKTKIWFTGSHGTGKTTQMNYFNSLHPEYKTLTTERRDLHEKGIINLNRRASPWDEVIISGNAMLDFIATSAPFISDRSWVCKCAYAQACNFPEKLIDAWHTVNVLSFFGFTENDIYIYFPPIIPLEDDGVRSIDPEYQKEIDFLVQFYLDFFGIPFHTLEAESVQDREMEIERLVFGRIT
jgi:nicotinamide riboside kinase